MENVLEPFPLRIVQLDFLHCKKEINDQQLIILTYIFVFRTSKNIRKALFHPNPRICHQYRCPDPNYQVYKINAKRIFAHSYLLCRI